MRFTSRHLIQKTIKGENNQSSIIPGAPSVLKSRGKWRTSSNCQIQLLIYSTVTVIWINLSLYSLKPAQRHLLVQFSPSAPELLDASEHSLHFIWKSADRWPQLTSLETSDLQTLSICCCVNNELSCWIIFSAYVPPYCQMSLSLTSDHMVCEGGAFRPLTLKMSEIFASSRWQIESLCVHLL